jgi:hypothetical protein
MSNLWRLIKHYLFEENNVSKKILGLQIIECCATYQELPSFISSTYQLMKILIDYYLGSVELFYIRHALSNTIIRLINNLVDPKRNTIFTVARVAKIIGIPQSLVTLRHDATHRVLPSLQVLILYANQALRWLRLTYWNKELVLLELPENIMKDILIYENKNNKTILEYVENIENCQNLKNINSEILLENKIHKDDLKKDLEDDKKEIDFTKKKKRKRLETCDEKIKKSANQCFVSSLDFAEVL